MFWLTQCVPLASMLLGGPQDQPPYGVMVRVQGYCYAGGAAIVFTVDGDDLAHDPLPCCIWVLPVKRLCRSKHPSWAVIQMFSSALTAVLYGMSSEEKNKPKNKTWDEGRRNKRGIQWPGYFLSNHFILLLHCLIDKQKCTSLQWAAPREQYLEWVNFSGEESTD